MHGKLQFFLPSFVNSVGKSNLLSERGKKKICTIGIGSCKVMVNQPAFVGADQQDVVGSSHGGDQAMALACIPFQSINGEHACLAILCEGIQIGQTVLRLIATAAHGGHQQHHHHHHKSVTIDLRSVFDTQHLSLCAAERKHYKQTANSKQHSIDVMMTSKRQSQSTTFSPLLLLRCCCYYSSLKAPIQTC